VRLLSEIGAAASAFSSRCAIEVTHASIPVQLGRALGSSHRLGPGRRSVDLAGPSSIDLPGALEHDNLVLAEVTAREIGRVTIAEALELTALVARKQPDRYGRFAARWLCLWLEEHGKATLEDVTVLVSSLHSLTTPKDHDSALAILRKAARRG
jgi:hypothetical protein